jgi:hypothetical protein
MIPALTIRIPPSYEPEANFIRHQGWSIRRGREPGQFFWLCGEGTLDEVLFQIDALEEAMAALALNQGGDGHA